MEDSLLKPQKYKIVKKCHESQITNYINFLVCISIKDSYGQQRSLLVSLETVKSAQHFTKLYCIDLEQKSIYRREEDPIIII